MNSETHAYEIRQQETRKIDLANAVRDISRPWNV